jgi:membrane protein
MPLSLTSCAYRIGAETISVALVRKIWERLVSDDCADLAAQVSFYFVLSLSPFFLVLASLLGWIPTTDRWAAFADWLTTYFPDQARRAILTNMLELSHGYASFLSIGLLATVWSASSGFLSLMEALSIAYGVKDDRSYFKKRLIATGATLVAAVFALLSFALWNFGHVVKGLLITDFHYLLLFQTQWRVARWIATLVLLFLGIDLINYFLPAEGRPWRWYSPGTVFVALAFGVATLGFDFFVTHGSNIPKIYGALAGFVVLMLWIYAANLILLIGAETDTAVRARRLHEAGA